MHEQLIELIGKNRGKFFSISREDEDWVSKFRWHLTGNGYVVRYLGKIGNISKYSRLSREIMKAKTGEIVDHIDRNPLNNTRENLRICTKMDNQRNTGMRKNNTSGFKGVSWNKNRFKWHAQITCNYKAIDIGHFESKREAAIAYNNKAKELFGEFAFLQKI